MQTRLFRRNYPSIAPERFVTVPNGFDEDEWQRLGPENGGAGAGGDGRFVLRYAGSLYQRRNPLPVFRALRRLMHRGEIGRDTVTVDLVGWCEVAEGRRVKDMAGEWGVVDCVRWSGPLGRAETLRRMRQADLLLLLAEDQPYQVPGKAYEYLRAGRPILALTSEGALAQLLRRTGGAWVLDPSDDAGIAAAIREAYALWREGREGPRADPSAVAAFDRRALVGRLAGLFPPPHVHFPREDRRMPSRFGAGIS
jgi:glycosyltransferase involved in cell wall biosynthesis